MSDDTDDDFLAVLGLGRYARSGRPARYAGGPGEPFLVAHEGLSGLPKGAAPPAPVRGRGRWREGDPVPHPLLVRYGYGRDARQILATHGGVPHTHLGAALHGLVRSHPRRDPVHMMSRAAYEGDWDALPALGDELQERNHPLAREFHWGAMPRALRIDELVHGGSQRALAEYDRVQRAHDWGGGRDHIHMVTYEPQQHHAVMGPVAAGIEGRLGHPLHLPDIGHYGLGGPEWDDAAERRAAREEAAINRREGHHDPQHLDPEHIYQQARARHLGRRGRELDLAERWLAHLRRHVPDVRPHEFLASVARASDADHPGWTGRLAEALGERHGMARRGPAGRLEVHVPARYGWVAVADHRESGHDRYAKMRAPGRPSGGSGAVSAGHVYRDGEFMAAPLKGSPPPAKEPDPRKEKLRALFAGRKTR